MSEKKNLRLDLYGAYDAGETRHAQEVMKSLGVTYIYAVPQSMSDCWWFLGCNSVPDDLPPYVGEMKGFDPHSAIGYGLSKEMANNLTGQFALSSPPNP